MKHFERNFAFQTARNTDKSLGRTTVILSVPAWADYVASAIYHANNSRVVNSFLVVLVVSILAAFVLPVDMLRILPMILLGVYFLISLFVAASVRAEHEEESDLEEYMSSLYKEGGWPRRLAMYFSKQKRSQTDSE